MRKIERIIDTLKLEPIIAAAPTPLRRAISRKRYGNWISNLEKMRYMLTGDNYSLREFDQYNCIFVHVPKCAGVSVTNAFFGNLAGGHVPLYMYLALFGSRRFSEMFKFTFVRNPWDRIASAYYFLKRGGMTKSDEIWAEKWLDECENLDYFICEILPNPTVREMIHFRTQCEFLLDPRTKTIGVDFIGRYENLENDFNYIALKLGLNTSLPKLNESKHNHIWQDEMSEKAISIIGKLYADDISYLDYDLPF
jgi:hypothetical protein